MSKIVNQFTEFVRDVYQTESIIPLHRPKFVGKEKVYVTDAINSSYVSSVGQYVETFEEMIAKYSKQSFGIATVNGTAALHVALKVAGVESNHDVLTQALTFIATVNAISYCSANPIFLDVDYDTLGLSPKSVQNFLEEYGDKRVDGTYNKISGNRISACLPMHTFGFPVHLKELQSVCSEWNIPLIEDAAESIGSTYNGRKLGSFGLIGTYSFNGNKIITAGGGGAIVTNHESLANKAKHLTTTAKVPHAYEYIHDETGYNYRMPNLNAALICAQLEQLDTFLTAKRALADKYDSFFSEKGITFRKENKNTKVNYWLMAIELSGREERDHFLTETNKNGVMTRPIWKLMHTLPMYEHCYRDDQKNAEYLVDRIVNIPSSVV